MASWPRLPGLSRLIETRARDGNGGLATDAPPSDAAQEPQLATSAVDGDHGGSRRRRRKHPWTTSSLAAVAAAMALVKAIRMHGHLAARLDPLGSEPPGDPALEPESLSSCR